MRGRFIRERLDGLDDEPRPGAPRQISDAQIEHVIVRTLERRRAATLTGAAAVLRAHQPLMQLA